jgi:transcriptional regulator with XRE-family HTH domain
VDAATLVRYARGKANLSQRELGRRAGVTQASIARIESGETSPRFETLDRLLSTCGFELEPVPKRGLGIDRSGIGQLLRLSPGERAHRAVEEARNLERIPRRPVR